MPSLYEGFSLPAIEAMSLRRAARGHHRRRPPRGRRRRRRHRAARAARATARRWPPSIAVALDDPDLRGPHRRRRPPAGHRPLDLAAHRRRHRRAVPGLLPDRQPPAPAAAPATRCEPEPAECSPSTTTGSGCAPATCCSTSGCGFGRHAFEAFRRGARVVALRLLGRRAEGRAGPLRAPWARPARPARPASRGRRVNGDATAPAVPRRHLRPHHRLRGARAHPRRRRPRSTS